VPDRRRGRPLHVALQCTPRICSLQFFFQRLVDDGLLGNACDRYFSERVKCELCHPRLDESETHVDGDVVDVGRRVSDLSGGGERWALHVGGFRFGAIDHNVHRWVGIVLDHLLLRDTGNEEQLAQRQLDAGIHRDADDALRLNVGPAPSSPLTYPAFARTKDPADSNEAQS
jgi:hypothetical protein